jgi:cytochrome c-type biogenesis protein CcmH
MTLRALAAALALGLLGLAPATRAAAGPASLADVENDVMCVSCHEPLAVAQSPQAYAERAFIRSLIAQGMTKAQIERQLVAQYGPAVLGRPPAHGFNLTVYVLPPAILALGIGVLVLILPRWRRRTAEAAGPARAAPRLDAAEERRLEEELSRYGG